MPDSERIRVTQIDAFTDRPFAGNPAGVLVVDEPADQRWMQAIAAEMNLSETAFLVAIEGGWNLRWFTPTTEVDLCGHATLASAFHLFTDHGVDRDELRFDTRSGWLTATRRSDGWIELDFPADMTTPVTLEAAPEGLLSGLGLEADDVVAIARGRTDVLVEVSDLDVVRRLEPDFRLLRQVPARGVSVTARGDTAAGSDHGPDFVSRFFAPGSGVDEDPVTGSAHCTLGPYWAARLGRIELLAHQVSARGGVVRVTTPDDGLPPWRRRVRLAGQAVHALQRA